MRNSKASRVILWTLIAIVVLLAAYSGYLLLHTDTGTLQQTGRNRTEVSFSWWGNDPRHEYTLQGIDRYEEMHPDIRIVPEYGVWSGYEYRYKIGMLSHTEADVMQINYAWISQYSPEGTGYYDLRKLSDYIDLTQFSETDLANCSVDGVLNGVPIAYNMPVILYNKDLFDRYGLDLPETWDDLFAAADVMSKDGVYPLTAVKKQLWLLLLAWQEQRTGTAAFTEDGKCQISEDDLKEILTFYKSLIDRKVLPPIDEVSHQFENETAAGILIWISDVDRYTGSLSEQGRTLVIGPDMTMDGTGFAGWHLKPASLLAVSTVTDHPEEAAKLVDYLINDPDFALLQGAEKGVPVSRKAYEALKEAGTMNAWQEEATERMMAHQDEITLQVPQVENDTLITIFKDESDKYLYDQESLEDCAKNIRSGFRDAGAGN